MLDLRAVLVPVLLVTALEAAAATVTVQQVTGRQFSPAIVAIQVGDTVEWVNADTMPHTATSGPEGSPDGRFDSGNMDPGQTFSYTFTAAGTQPYYCDYHNGMVGTVIVVDGALVRQVPGRRFDPPTLAVRVGETVTWVNVDTMPHTATSGPEGSPDGRFDSANMDPGQTFSYTFTAAGMFPYYCDYHSGMVGTVEVTGSVPPILLHLVKSGLGLDDVALSWSGGASPHDIHRGMHVDLATGLPLWQAGVGASSVGDPGATPSASSLYYDVR